MNKLRKSFLYFFLAITFLSVDACRKKYNPTAEDMTEYGWILYKSKDYLNSNTWFQDGATKDAEWKDAYDGLGWSYAKLMVLDSSISNFIIGLDKPDDEWNIVDIQSEILAGLTFAYNAKGDDGRALQYGRAFLDSTVKPLAPGWVFTHDSLLNYLDVRVVMAASYFAKGKFDSTILQISVILDSLGSKVSMSPITDTSLEGRKRMAAQIDSLQDYLRNK